MSCLKTKLPVFTGLYFLPSPSFVLDVLAQRFRSLTFKALPFFAHIVSKDEVAGFPGFFLWPDDFAPNVCSLQTLLPMLALLMLMLLFCFFVSQASLARLLKTELTLALRDHSDSFCSKEFARTNATVIAKSPNGF